MSKRVIGFWSGHDCSFCVLNDGKPEIHTELERHNREKEPAGDSIQLFFDHCNDTNNVVGFATCHRSDKVTASPRWKELLINSQTTNLHECGHHEAHASHAFYSSNFDEALVLTIDGGGYEDDSGQFTATMSMWHGKDTKLDNLGYVGIDKSNVGGVWSRVTRYVFRMESGWPQGHQAGSVMALAAPGNSSIYIDNFRKALNEELHQATSTPQGHVKGMSAKDARSPKHDYWRGFEDLIASRDRSGEGDQMRFNIAAALQRATEEHIFEYVDSLLKLAPHVTKLCLAGGVALNSVMVGKIIEKFPQLTHVFIPPVPYDGGLAIGAAQHLWHHVLGNPRVKWDDNFTPYLGETYSKDDVMEALQPFIESDEITLESSDVDKVIEYLIDGCVVSVFHGRAESGRRALGNRSIIADPRNPKTKDRVNLQVKHRQDWRPFAPSILREAVPKYFEIDCESPYMSHVLKFQEWARPLLPAVVHFDGSARLQTVTAKDNPWYHDFLTRWEKASGHPVILNTSFNDREPIVEIPADAIKCFLKTSIDYLFFPEFNLLVKKNVNY